jgi:hypothetical protein
MRLMNSNVFRGGQLMSELKRMVDNVFETSAVICDTVSKEFEYQALVTPSGPERNELTAAAMAAKVCAARIRKGAAGL